MRQQGTAGGQHPPGWDRKTSYGPMVEAVGGEIGEARRSSLPQQDGAARGHGLFRSLTSRGSPHKKRLGYEAVIWRLEDWRSPLG